MSVLPDWMLDDSIVKPCEPGVKRPGKVSYGITSYGYDARVGYKFKVFTPALCAEVDPKSFDPLSFVEVDITPHDGAHVAMGTFLKCRYCLRSQSEWTYAPVCDKRPQPPAFVRIPPNSFALAETVERFTIPRDCLALVVGKSTYARCGVIVNVTPLEPEWEGTVTVEISNTTPMPARIYGGEGIMQVVFLRSDGHRSVLSKCVQELMEHLRGSYPYTLTAAMTGNSPAPMTCRTSYADKGGKYQGQSGVVHPKVD